MLEVAAAKEDKLAEENRGLEQEMDSMRERCQWLRVEMETQKHCFNAEIQRQHQAFLEHFRGGRPDAEPEFGTNDYGEHFI
eukprot:g9092.t1